MNRRGLTLIEILAATVILSSSAAVCAAMLRSARMALQTPRASNQELAVLADALMDDPESFGIGASELTTIGSLSIGWASLSELAEPGKAEHIGRAPVLVSLIKSNEQSKGILPHGWLVFEYDGATVIRYLPLPEDGT